MTAQEVKYSNFFETTLNGIVAGSATAMTLNEAPTSNGSTNIEAPYYLVIDPDNENAREVVEVTASSGTSITAMTRDKEGRHASDPDHSDGTTVRMAVIKEMFEDIHDRIDVGLVNENLFRNGNCLAHQNSEPAAGSYTLTSSFAQVPIDGWYGKTTSAASISTQESGIASGSMDDRPFDAPLRFLDVSSGGTFNQTFIVQPIANQPYLYRRQMTLSCWFRSSSASKPAIQGHYSFNYTIGDDTSGSGDLGGAVTATSEWQKFEHTFTWDPGTYGAGSSTSTYEDHEEGYFGFKITQGTGTGGDIKITGMKLELGTVATQNTEIKAEEVNECEKFIKRYGRNFAASSNDLVIATGVATSTTAYKVFMPITPMWTNKIDNIVLGITGTLEIAGASYEEDVTSVTFPNYSGASGNASSYPGMIMITGTISSGTFTSGEFLELRAANNRGFITVDAESFLLP